MGTVIDYCAYVTAKKEEQERIKKVSMLSAKNDDVLELLNNADGSIGALLVTKHLDTQNHQFVEEKNVIDFDLLHVIINAIKQYKDDIQRQIVKLQSCK